MSSFQISVLFLLDIYQGVDLLDHMVVSLGNSAVFAAATATIYIPINSVSGLFTTSWPIYGFCGLVNGSYSDRCEVLSYFGFNLHFSDK